MKRLIEFSKLTNHQLKYLLRHGEIHFEDGNLAEKKRIYKQQVQGIERKFELFKNVYDKLNAELDETAYKYLDGRLNNVFGVIGAQTKLIKFKPVLDTLMKQIKITNANAMK